LGFLKDEDGNPIPVFNSSPIRTNKLKRNKPCICGSGNKFKKCCYPKQPQEVVVEETVNS
jgi:uncharacterized protein YecA (UPF0149 family)